MIAISERPGFARSFKPSRTTRQPRRLHRVRGRKARTPEGAIYVGRPTVWGNPFAGQPKIGHARSVILYRAWIQGDVSQHVLERAGFSDAEIMALARWRQRLLSRLDELIDADLQCWCPPTSEWCHADVLLSEARKRGELRPLHSATAPLPARVR